MKKRHSDSVPIAVAVGVITGLAMTMLGTVIVTQMINTSAITSDTLGIICPIIWLISSFAGNLATAVISSQKVMLGCGICSGIYYFILFGISGLFLDGSYSQAGWGIICTVLGMAPALALFLRKNSGKKKKYKYRKL